jgi:enediyne biosynthesis protein E4
MIVLNNYIRNTIFSNVLILSILLLLFACKKPSEDTLFESLDATTTGINFVNKSLERNDFNVFNYRNFYNGGGVAIGDINNDGLSDVFVTSNFEENKLYLNKGNMHFEDISKQAGITAKKFWSTGVTFADVNGDGFVDIYVCNSGSKDARGNQLYLNSPNTTKGGIPHFTEVAEKVGLKDGGFSTHAAFFDYDRDGDLDMYLLNNSFIPINKLGYKNLRNERDSLGGDKLFRNDTPLDSKNNKDIIKFTDVSAEAGIFGSLIGFGLGITIGDVNNDNWPDIYISNDFYERDYLYINQKNGKFKEDIENQMAHISLSSMGADIADINNDGNLDIFVTDMLPGNDKRLKTTSMYEGEDLFRLKLKNDFWYQYMRNMMHINNGDGTFTEVGQYANVHATDWSWGALLFDMDNDGKKDIFVANGILKDLTDQDFVNYMGDRSTMEQMLGGKSFEAKMLIDKITSVPIPNYAFKNNGDLQFNNEAKKWGLEGPGFSNGAAYGDLDNDGDLDLIVNNVNSPLSVFRNKSNEKKDNHYLTVSLKGNSGNQAGIGAKIFLYQNGSQQMLQQMPNRGFQSSCDTKMLFGLGTNAKIDSLKVLWPNDRFQIIIMPNADKLITLDIKDANQLFVPNVVVVKTIFNDITAKTLQYDHLETDINDYNRDALLKQKLSTQGPAMAVGDVNGDGLDDVYIGGAAGQDKQLFIQNANGKFVLSTQPDFASDKTTENTDALFFDADGDKDLDLVVITGSNEFLTGEPQLHDRLYLNNGKGQFSRDVNYPLALENGSCVAAADFDRDGDIDLFVGSRMISSQYGKNPPHFLYVNNGKGQFTAASSLQKAPLAQLGMVTDAEWADTNGDGYPELIVTQDWGGIQILQNDKGKIFTNTNVALNSDGLWNCLKTIDLDGDGDMDFVVGNRGENSKLKASNEIPAKMFSNDFDYNGTIEQIITAITEDGKAYPMVLKGDLQKAIPSIKTKFIKYIDYASKTIDEIFTKDQLQNATVKQVNTLKSSYFINDGIGNFNMKPLPIEAQFSTINAIESGDFNHDGQIDLALAGNFYDVLPEWGRQDGNSGLILYGNGKNEFKLQKSAETGFRSNGQVRKMKEVKGPKGSKILILAKNNDLAQVFSIK